jgi:hypothetical protein
MDVSDQTKCRGTLLPAAAKWQQQQHFSRVAPAVNVKALLAAVIAQKVRCAKKIKPCWLSKTLMCCTCTLSRQQVTHAIW